MMTVAALNPLDFSLHGARLIEASAGTGKTWTIAALYVRLILNHAADESSRSPCALIPPQILVVTFTEAATQELRYRIRKRLTEAARFFRNPHDNSVPDDDFLKELYACYSKKAEREHCARLLTVAAEWMDEAAIYTIHGWCHRMLKQHAFHSGSLFTMELEADDSERLLQVAQDYWRIFFYQVDEAACTAIRQIAATPDTLLTQIKGLLSTPEDCWSFQGKSITSTQDPHSLLKEWSAWEAKRVSLEDTARKSWAGAIEKLDQQLLQFQSETKLDGRAYPNDLSADLKRIHDWACNGKACEISLLQKYSSIKVKKKFETDTHVQQYINSKPLF